MESTATGGQELMFPPFRCIIVPGWIHLSADRQAGCQSFGSRKAVALFSHLTLLLKE